MHYKRGGTTQQCAGTIFYFLQQQWPEQTTQVSGKQTFTSSSGSPRFLVRENDSLQAFRTAKEYRFLRPGLSFAQTYTHKGRDPQQPTNKKVEIDPRAAPRRTSPRPLSLSPFSSRLDIQPRGAFVGGSADRFSAMVSARPPSPPTATGAALSILHADRRP